jgi:aryl carrier-like protein
MKRTIVSLPLDENIAKETAALAKKDGKTRVEYLRNLIMGHLRMVRMRQLQERVAKRGIRTDFSEEQVVEFVREVRRERAREKEARA